MIAPRTPSPTLLRLALGALLALNVGCGANPPEVDTAETIRTDPAKPATTPVSTPSPTPEAAPTKEVPKG